MVSNKKFFRDYFEFFFFFKSLADEAKRTSLRDALPLIYDAIDSNKDGSISKEEFANYFKSLNINDNQTAYDAFSAMDANNDGTLSKEGMLSIKKKMKKIFKIFYLFI